MNKLLLLILILTSNNCIAQHQVLDRAFVEKNGSVITGRPLRLEDFKGKPDRNSPATAETHSALLVKVEKTGDVSKDIIKVHRKVLPYFLNTSWVKGDVRNFPGPYIVRVLQHEQDHYNLAILASIEIEKAFATNVILDNRSSDPALEKIYNKDYAQYLELNKFYESDSNYGKDENEQVLWDKNISEALKARSWENLLEFKIAHSNHNIGAGLNTIVIKGFTGKYSFGLKQEPSWNLDKSYDDITLISIASNQYYEAQYKGKTIYVKQSAFLSDSNVLEWKKEKLKNIERSLNKEVYNKYFKEFGSKYTKDIIQGNLRIGMPGNAVRQIMGQPQMISRVQVDNTEKWTYQKRNGSESYFLYFKNDSLARWIGFK